MAITAMVELRLTGERSMIVGAAKALFRNVPGPRQCCYAPGGMPLILAGARDSGPSQ